jgi:hypothetical protein
MARETNLTKAGFAAFCKPRARHRRKPACFDLGVGVGRIARSLDGRAALAIRVATMRRTKTLALDRPVAGLPWFRRKLIPLSRVAP